VEYQLNTSQPMVHQLNVPFASSSVKCSSGVCSIRYALLLALCLMLLWIVSTLSCSVHGLVVAFGLTFPSCLVLTTS